MLVNKNKKRQEINKKSNPKKVAVPVKNSFESNEGKINQFEKKSSQVNRKRKLSSDDEHTDSKVKLGKFIKTETHESEDESITDDSENEPVTDDSENEPEIDNKSDDKEMVSENPIISTLGKRSEQQLKNQEAAQNRKDYNAEHILKRKQEMKIKKEESMKGVKEMFLDTPKVESESLKEQIHKRLVDRMNKTIVMSNIPNKFNVKDAMVLVPDMISCVIPYNAYYHKVGGTAYIDVDSREKAALLADKLRNSEIKGRKPLAMVQTRIIEDVDKYNCQRLVLSNISCKTTLDQIRAVFTNAKRIELIPLKSIDRKMTMTAFAEYESVEEAIADYDSKHGALINDNPVNVKFQIRKEANIKDKTHLFDRKRLTVMGVRENATIAEFKRCFPKSSKIQEAFKKGMAHIVYTNEEDCANDKALLSVHSPPAKWRVSYAIGGPKVQETVPPPKKLKEKAPRPMKKEGGSKDNKKKMGDRKFGKKFSGDKKSGNNKTEDPVKSKDTFHKNASEMAKIAKKNDEEIRKEKRKLKKERRRLRRAENVEKMK